MTTEITRTEPQLPAPVDFSPERVQLLKDTICRGATNDELRLFIEICKSKRLDPFARQIHAVKRWDANLQREITSYQTGIDGFRLIADRTGKYEGQGPPMWCGEDGRWHDVWLSSKPPVAAKATVYRTGFREPLVRVALYREYAQLKRDGTPNSMWQKMPASQLSKCFAPDTEVLTDLGFQRFGEVTGRIMQVTEAGLEPTDARPFSQPYSGLMVTSDLDMLNFCVTPNHDMVTTFGKAEAGAIYRTGSMSSNWRIPLTIEPVRADAPFTDKAIVLAAIIAADGNHNGYRRFDVAVSRPRKIAELRTFQADSECVVHSRGAIAVTEVREIRSNFDKIQFSFDIDRTEGLVGPRKSLDTSLLLTFSQRQARLFIDAWIRFDGSTNKKTGVRRLYTSRPEYLQIVELVACAAGYSVNVPRISQSDIGSVPNFRITISEPKPPRAMRPIATMKGMQMTPNSAGEVWCCTVPSGVIMVRRNGFSMPCGNCSETLALRAAFPEELSGIYTSDEMGQADNPEPEPQAFTPRPEPVIEPKPALKTWPGVPEDIQELWRGMNSIPTIVKLMEELHECLAEYEGADSADRRYRAILGKYTRKDGKPVEHSNQFAKFRDAWDAARELLEVIKKMKATREVLHVSEADIVEDKPEVNP